MPLGRGMQDSHCGGKADFNPSLSTNGGVKKFISECKTRTEIKLAAPSIPSVAH